jgi:class 3 adenylate cyclase
MSEMRVKRRLSAILAADVVGYSRLMGVDEEGTLAALKIYRRELLDPKIAEHRGALSRQREMVLWSSLPASEKQQRAALTFAAGIGLVCCQSA